MTATDPRPELAAMPAASRPKPPPPLAGYRMHTSVFGGLPVLVCGGWYKA